ncbi:hypothetical protein BSKO_00757 [Bryopsis sp. KO-2023]|nr:hypothetical protein BSKO_00757 [Bryopsis sp. KO-2023]
MKLSLFKQEVQLPDTQDFHDFLNGKPWSPKHPLARPATLRFNPSTLRERLKEASCAERRGCEGGFVEGTQLEPDTTSIRTRPSLGTLNGAGCGELEMCRAEVFPKIKEEVEEVMVGAQIGKEEETEKAVVQVGTVSNPSAENHANSIMPPVPDLPVPDLVESPQVSHESSETRWIQCDVCFRWRREKDIPIFPTGSIEHWSCDIDGRNCSEVCDWCKVEPCSCRNQSSYSGFLMSGYTLPPGFRASMKFRAGREPLTVGGPYLNYVGYCERCAAWSGGMDRRQKVAAWLHAHRDHNPDWARLTELNFDFRLDEQTKELYRVYSDAKRAQLLRVGPSDDIIPSVVVNAEENKNLQEKVKQFESLVRDCRVNPCPKLRKRSMEGGGRRTKRQKVRQEKKNGAEGAAGTEASSPQPVKKLHAAKVKSEHQGLKKTVKDAGLGNAFLVACSADLGRVLPDIVVPSTSTGMVQVEAKDQNSAGGGSATIKSELT